MKTLYKFPLQKIMMVICLFLCLSVFRSSGANTLYMVNVSGGPKSNIIIDIGVNNSDPFNAFQFDLLFPEQLKWVANGVRLTSRQNGHNLSATLIEPGKLRIIAYSITNADFTGTSGSIVEVDFRTEYQPGTYPIVFEKATLSGNDRNILDNSVNGQFTLLSPKLVNSSDEIDFDSIPLFKEYFRSITLTNTGNINLTVNSLVVSDARFSISEPFPLTLLPGNSRKLTIRLYSEVKGNVQELLTISSNDPTGDKICALKAIAFAVNEIHLGSISARSGYEAEIPVSVNNMEDFCALQFRLALPSVARFVMGSERLHGVRKTDHVISADTSGNTLTLLTYSPTNSHFKEKEGIVLFFKVFLEGQGGNYSFTPLEPVISNFTSENILSASFASEVRIAAPQINIHSLSLDFGNVSVLKSGIKDLTISNPGDDQLHISHISIIEDPSFKILTPFPFTILPGSEKTLSIQFESSDGKLHVSRLRIRSNDFLHDPIDISMRAQSFFPNEIRIQDCQTIAGNKDTLYVELFNQSAINAFQFDLEYPDCITMDISEIFLTGRKEDHVFAVSELSSGKLRILSYSGSLKSYSGIDGPVLGIPVMIASGVTGLYPLTVSAVVISDILGASVATGSHSGTILIQPVTNGGEFQGIMPEVFPNPAGDYLLINNLPDPGANVSYEIFSANGLLVYADKQNATSNSSRIRIMQLKPGLYYLIIRYGKNYLMHKFIKI